MVSNEIEKRTFQCEVRAEGDDKPKIVGYGAVFNRESSLIAGWFKEIIEPSAFDHVLDDDVRGLFNHDPNYILGRTEAGTLSLGVDETGLRYEITPPETQTIQDLVMQPLIRGDITQSSFAFSVAIKGDEWDEDEKGVVIRTITKIQRLYDVSPVTYPAYPDASAATRSHDAWKESRNVAEVKKALFQRQSRERLLQLIKT